MIYKNWVKNDYKIFEVPTALFFLDQLMRAGGKQY